MRQGTVRKRCRSCGRSVMPQTCPDCDGRVRSGACSGCGLEFDPKRCIHCESTSLAWAWQVDVAPKGAPRDLRAGTAETKAEALAEMSDVQQEAAAGTLVEPSKLTLGIYLGDQWLPAYKAEVRPGTWAAAEGHVRNYIRPRIGEVPMQSLTRTVIKGMYADLRETGAVRGDGGLSEKTVHNVHLTLHRALEDAVDDRLLSRNPAAAGRRGKALHTTPERPQIETWTPQELGRFEAEAATRRLWPLFRLAAYSGMRRGELCGLLWRDLDLDAGTVTVSRQRVKTDDGVGVGRPKTKRGERTFDIDPQTVAVLREWRKHQMEEQLMARSVWADTGLVFTTETGGGLHPDVVSQAFDRIVERTDVPRITLHGLRHTHATILLASGVALHVVSRRLGHASEAFTAQVYGHVLPSQQAEAAARFAAAIGG